MRFVGESIRQQNCTRVSRLRVALVKDSPKNYNKTNVRNGIDPNTALVEPWCHPSILRPSGLLFKWILSTTLIRGWKSELNSMWCNGKESGADQITASDKKSGRMMWAWMESPKWPRELIEAQKQWRRPLKHLFGVWTLSVYWKHVWRSRWFRCQKNLFQFRIFF